MKEQIQKIKDTIAAEQAKNMFGDHITITFRRDGTTQTEEYVHD